jgi:oligosaccharide repeat unit polymerase
VSTQATFDPLNRRRLATLYVLAHMLLMCGLFVLCAARWLAGPALLLRPLAVVAVCELTWVVWSWWHVTRSFFDFYMILVLGSALGHSGYFYLALRGGEEAVLEGGGAGLRFEAMLLILAGHAALHLGALTQAHLAYRQPMVRDEAHLAENEPLGIKLGWILLLASIIPFALYALGGLNALRLGGYPAVIRYYNSEASIYWYGVRFLIPGAFLLMATGRNDPRRLRTSVGALLLFVGFHLFGGNRLRALAVAIPAVWLWHVHVRPIPRLALAGGGILMVTILLPLVMFGPQSEERASGVARNAQAMNTPVDKLFRYFTPLSVEMVMSVVPVREPPERGGTYARAILHLLPDALAHRIQAERKPPAEWLMSTISSSFARRGSLHTAGFSYIAEAYLNFAWAGTPLWLGLIGFLLAAFHFWCQSGDPLERLVLGANLLVFLLGWLRTHSYEVIRSILIYAILPYVALIYARWRQKRKTASV